MSRSLLCLAAFCMLGIASDVRAAIVLSADLWVDATDTEIVLTSYATAEDPECDGPLSVTAEVLDTNGNSIAYAYGDGGWCSPASAQATKPIDYDSFVDGEYTARGVAWNNSGIHGCSLFSAQLEQFTAVWRYAHPNGDLYEYDQDISVCNGKCQPPRVCTGIQAAWAWNKGVKIATPAVSYCQWTGNFQHGSSHPACQQRFGFYLGGFNDRCPF